MAPKAWERSHDRPGARSLVVPNPRACPCPCCEAVHFMHVNQSLRSPSCLPPTLVATAGSLVLSHGGEVTCRDQLWCVMFPDATLSHAPLDCLFRTQGVGRRVLHVKHVSPAKTCHRSEQMWREIWDEGEERRRRLPCPDCLPMHLCALCDAYHGHERLKDPSACDGSLLLPFSFAPPSCPRVRAPIHPCLHCLCLCLW